MFKVPEVLWKGVSLASLICSPAIYDSIEFYISAGELMSEHYTCVLINSKFHIYSLSFIHLYQYIYTHERLLDYNICSHLFLDS